MKQHITNLATYNIWANNLVISWLQQLTNEQLHQNINSSFNSIFKTVLHIVGAEKAWYNRINNQTIIWFPSVFTGQTKELIEAWISTSEHLKTTIANFEENNYYNNLNITSLNGQQITMQYLNIFTHVLNHSTYHRGQIVTMLRQVGFTNITSLDYSTFCTK